MTSLRIQPMTLKGNISAQPSKSMAHRAIICAALAKGESNIDNVVLSEDITATLGAIKALGADAEINGSTRYSGKKIITVNSSGKVLLRDNIIDCLESGSTARFIMPVTRLVSDTVTISGRNRLIERPFTVYKELFGSKGITYKDSNGKMPISLTGKLTPGQYSIAGDVSSQFISGLLLVLPLLDGPSKIEITNKLESLPYVQMTIDILSEFGITMGYDFDYMNLYIPGGQTYKAIPYYLVEGDWSQAAFFCVMGLLSDSVSIGGLNLKSLQGDRVILDILKRMGGRFSIKENIITFEKSELYGTEIDVSQCPDLVPAISAAASLASGTTKIFNAARLRIKESDRLMTTCRELKALGADIREETDGLIIKGVPRLKGGIADGSGDHRIVMALAAASVVCENPVEIIGTDAVNKSYPEFWKDFDALGGRIEEI